MSEEKIWFQPDMDYSFKTTGWMILLPTISGWYDTKPLRWIEGKKIERAYVPYVERRWFDADTGTWSASCMVGDPDEFEQTVRKVGRKVQRSLLWRGLIEKPIYPPDYYN